MAVVLHQDQVDIQHARQVLVSVVVEIDQQRAARAIKPVDTCRASLVTHRAVGLLNQQPVGHATRLAKVDIVQPVAVDVTDGQPLVTVQRRAQFRLQPTPPVIDTASQLITDLGSRLQHSGSRIDIQPSPRR